MKRIILIFTFFSATLFAITSCDPQGKEPQPDPVLEITTNNGQILTEAMADEYSFNYELTNPIEDGRMNVEIPETCDWISNPVIDENTKTITITLDENISKESRSEILTVRYTYGEKEISTAASIIQEASTFDYVMIATHGATTWFDTMLYPDADLYAHQLELSNAPLDDYYDNSLYYAFDVYNSSKSEDKTLLPGTYTVHPSDPPLDMTLGIMSYGEWIGIMDNDEYLNFEFKDGSINIEKNGNIYTIIGTLIDKDDNVHSIRFEGELYNEEF